MFEKYLTLTSKSTSTMGWVGIIDEASQFGKEMVAHGAGGHG
jgi:hypothetical protein